MAFVILSTGSLTRCRTRTFKLGVLLGVVGVCLLGAVAGGFWLGQQRAPSEPLALEVVSVPDETPDPLPHSDLAAIGPHASPATSASDVGRHLVDRLGELVGRVIQLEAEALEMAARVGAIVEFEARVKPDEAADVPVGRAARTQPGLPSGGPLLQPLLAPLEDRLPLDALSLDPDGSALDGDFAWLEASIARVSDLMAQVDEAASQINRAHMSFPGRSPVVGVMINSGFGNRRDPITRRPAFHSGVDFAAPRGTPIYASAGGRVIFAGHRRHYGQTVEIDHGAGLVTRYAHASRVLVKRGQVVLPGEEIARVGSTGRSTGPHLHFEILKDGHFVDPSVYLAKF